MADCDRLAVGRGLCDRHYQRVRANGTTDLVGLPSGERHPAWTGAAASYDAIHQRLRKRRGRAADLPCHDCGANARHWSYNGASTERMPTDPDLEAYVPRCVPCHKRFDLDRKKILA